MEEAAGRTERRVKRRARAPAQKRENPRRALSLFSPPRAASPTLKAARHAPRTHHVSAISHGRPPAQNPAAVGAQGRERAQKHAPNARSTSAPTSLPCLPHNRRALPSPSQVAAGPRDPPDRWAARLKEELSALISTVSANKASQADWFKISPADAKGLSWHGTAWATHDLARYAFGFEFEVPAAYPAAPPAIRIPSLDGKTAKMWRGGAICLDAHFAPLWAKNAPRFGLAHALALGLGPWLAAEVPSLVAAGAEKPEEGRA